MEISSLSHLVRSMIPREHMASIYTQGSLVTSTCGIGPDSTDTVSKISGQGVACWVFQIGCLVEKPYIWCQEK